MRGCVAMFLAVVAWWSGPARAAGAPPLVVTLDKAQVLHLKVPARRVIVGNPAIADVSLETPTLLYVFGKTAGETNLTVLGGEDHAVVSRSVVVTAGGERMVSVYMVDGTGPVSRTYSCLPNRCLRVGSPDLSPNGGGPAAPPSTGSGAQTVSSVADTAATALSATSAATAAH